MTKDPGNIYASDAISNVFPVAPAFADALAGVSEAYAESVAAFQEEVASFLSQRWAADLALPGEIAKCRDLGDIALKQQDWLTEAVQDYADEAMRLVDLAQREVRHGLKPWFEAVLHAFVPGGPAQSEDDVPLVMME